MIATSTVVIAEDDMIIRKVFSKALQQSGLTVIESEDGEMAVKKIKSENPKLIILDLKMPKKNGLDVLKEIREDNKMDDTPIIVISNLDEETYRQKSLDMGADKYMTKVKVSISDVIEATKQYI